MNLLKIDDTICAIATGGNESAIAVIRVTGDYAIKFTNSIFSKNLINVSSHSIHYGDIIENNAYKKFVNEVESSNIKHNELSNINEIGFEEFILKYREEIK